MNLVLNREEISSVHGLPSLEAEGAGLGINLQPEVPRETEDEIESAAWLAYSAIPVILTAAAIAEAVMNREILTSDELLFGYSGAILGTGASLLLLADSDGSGKTLTKWKLAGIVSAGAGLGTATKLGMTTPVQGETFKAILIGAAIIGPIARKGFEALGMSWKKQGLDSSF